MTSLVFWTDAKPPAIKATVGVSLQRLQHLPAHRFQAIGVTPYVPAPDEIVLAMGDAAFKHIQALGLAPKNRALDGLRGTVFTHSGGGRYMLSHAPYAPMFDPGKQWEIEWDVQLIARLARTGSLDAELGDYRWVEDFSELIATVEARYAETGKPVPVAGDLETVGLSPFAKGARIISLGFTADEGRADLVYVPDLKSDIQAQALIASVRWLLTSEKVRLRGANFKFDLNWLLVSWGLTCTNYSMDTLLVGSLLNENRSNSLKAHIKIYATALGGYDDGMGKAQFEAMHLVPKEDMRKYLGGDVDGTLRVSNVMLRELPKQPTLGRFYTKISHPTSKVFRRIEHEGVPVDLKAYARLKTDLETEIAKLTKEGLGLLPARLRAKYMDNLSLSRPAVLRDYFFSPMGLNLKPRMVTERNGEPSTARAHLEMFSDTPEATAFCTVLDGLNQANKALSTYVIGFLEHLRPDGKLHPTYFLHRGDGEGMMEEGGGRTGRTSAKDPAIQTVPKKTKWGKRIRECFVALPGHILIQCDYSQGELRIAACIAEETNMIEAYLNKIDLHVKTGAGLSKMEVEALLALKIEDPALYDLIRSRAKPANFGILYEVSAQGYVNYAWNGYRLKMTLDEAQDTIDGFFNTYPGLPVWHKRAKAQVRQQGYMTSVFGRVRHLPQINSSDRQIASKAGRQAINFEVQPVLTDMMTWSLSEVDQQYPQFAPIAMIHDAGIWMVPEDQAQGAAHRITDIMENLPLRETFGWSPPLSFPGDAEAGPNMAALKAIK